MFTETPNSNELRQGDIIQGLYYPMMRCEKLSLIGAPTDPMAVIGENLNLSAVPHPQKERGMTWFTAQVQVFRGFSIILSQCCDLELHDDKLDAPAFVVSPLVDISYPIRTDPDKLAILKQNGLEEGFANLFYVPQQSPLPKDYMVDLTMLASIPRSEFKFALTAKVLQMTDEERIRLKLKLTHHFGRPTQEEIDRNLYPTS